MKFFFSPLHLTGGSVFFCFFFFSWSPDFCLCHHCYIHAPCRMNYIDHGDHNSNPCLLDFHKKYLIFSPLMLLRGWIFMFSQTSWPLLVVILVCQYFQLYSRYFMISTTDFHPISWTHSCFQEGWCFSAALMINSIFSLTNSFECRFDLLASSNPIWALRQQKNCLKKHFN